MEIIKEKLSELGLSNKEIDVYLSILSSGKSTVSDIARYSKMKRTTAYQYIESVLEKNLIYKSLNKKRVLYCAEDPKKIILLLERRKREIDEKRHKLEKIMPQLQSLYSKSFSRPNISFYEGKEGLKKVYLEMLDTHKNVYSMFSPESFFKIFTFNENNEFLMTLYKKGGTLHNLVERSEKAKERLGQKQYEDFVKNKLLPEGFKYETDLLVSDDKVVLISFSNLIAVMLTDKAIADLMKNTIKLIWKMV